MLLKGRCGPLKNEVTFKKFLNEKWPTPTEGLGVHQNGTFENLGTYLHLLSIRVLAHTILLCTQGTAGTRVAGL